MVYKVLWLKDLNLGKHMSNNELKMLLKECITAGLFSIPIIKTKAYTRHKCKALPLTIIKP